jgi:hypothetical protein
VVPFIPCSSTTPVCVGVQHCDETPFRSRMWFTCKLSSNPINLPPYVWHAWEACQLSCKPRQTRRCCTPQSQAALQTSRLKKAHCAAAVGVQQTRGSGRLEGYLQYYITLINLMIMFACKDAHLGHEQSRVILRLYMQHAAAHDHVCNGGVHREKRCAVGTGCK